MPKPAPGSTSIHDRSSRVPDDLITALRQVVLKLLGPRPAAARRRAIAEALEQLAAEQRQLADADSHVGHHLRRAVIESQPRSAKGGRPPGHAARFLRVELRNAVGGARIFVGRGLWQDLGEPARLDPQQRGSQRVLVPVAEGGFAVIAGSGMPRFTCGAEIVQFLRLDYDTRYACAIEAGAIVIGEALEQEGA
jgi:hypothetical protein